MSLKVVGAGFGRTGTMSLKLALEQLGFDKCYHMMEVTPEHREPWVRAHRGEAIDWDALLEGFQASVDWPSCNLWREQLAQWPDAKVILSLRDPESWYASIMNTIYPMSTAMARDGDGDAKAFGNFAVEVVWNHVFNGRVDDKDFVIGVFNKHNETVKAELPPEKLLVFEAKEGWGPLCEFLEVDVPDTDYPRVNTTEEFAGGASQAET